ncbi:beta-galactosidase [Chloroflexus sp.]|uniref:beta-galactosidase n=1 Tax=Chloroflexus sp. TaxID=1904827 RepID=UPI002581167C|nr:beta-galactosidase [Chloroflexus sp.]
MPAFTAHHQRFWLDDRPLFIQAGEFHYFRTPATDWEQRLDLLVRAGFNAVACYIPWLWHQPQPDQIDLTGTTHPLRNLAGFLDLAAQKGLYVIARPGPYIMAETINEGIPPWVFDHHPEIALINQHGTGENVASFMHPSFLSCVAGWYQAVFAILSPRQITRGGPILMVQLDNEMGMLHWVRNSFDLNPITMQYFANWLQATYGEDMRVDPQVLATRLRHAEGAAGAQLVADYRRFFRSYLRDYAQWLTAEARRHGLDTPAVFNIHGFANGGKTFPIGLSQLAGVLRLPDVISATDVYPGQIGEGTFHQLLLVNAMTCAIQNPDQPLFSIEFQAGGNLDFSNMSSSFYDLHTRLCLSNGMRAINHYLFFDGENDPILSPVKRHDWGHPVRKDGTLRSHYHRYPRLSQTIASYGDALILSRPQPVTTIGFRLDDFMTEVNLACTQEETAIITHQREVILFDLIARGLALTQRDFQALDLQHTAPDPQQVPLLWVMLDCNSDPATEQTLLNYLEAGGKVVLIGRLRTDGVLATALNVHPHTDPPFTSRRVHIFTTPDIPASFVQTYQGDLETVFATADGAAVGFRKRVGQGELIMLGASFPITNLDDLHVFRQLAEWVNCPAPFTLSTWADVRLSRGPDGDFLFVNHYGDDPLETHIHYQGQPLCDGHPIRLPPRSGAILPLNWQVRPGITVRYTTVEVRSITETADGLTFTFAQPEGYACFAVRINQGSTEDRSESIQHVHFTNGTASVQWPIRTT